MPTENPIGLAIQRARHRKHMTQEQLAETLGVSKSAVADWERGEHYPLRNAGAIEAVLDITIPAAGSPAADADEIPA